MQELIQNADDAGATEVRFLVDPREHPPEGLPNEHFKKYRGPALFAWNDATFKRNDWDCLAKIDRSEKEKEVMKVGRFGLGFLSVFHVTGIYGSVAVLIFVVPNLTSRKSLFSI